MLKGDEELCKEPKLMSYDLSMYFAMEMTLERFFNDYTLCVLNATQTRRISTTLIKHVYSAFKNNSDTFSPHIDVVG